MAHFRRRRRSEVGGRSELGRRSQPWRPHVGGLSPAGRGLARVPVSLRAVTDTPDPLDSLVHLSQLLGGDTRLVQPGGGNTSIKVGDALLVKGSGTDLRTIGREGFTRLSLARLAPLGRAPRR